MIDDQRPVMTNNEAVAYTALGETNALVMDMKGTTAEDVVRERNIRLHNDAVDKYTERFQEHTNKLQKYAEDLSKNIDNIEIMPLGNYVLIKPFTENPFQRIVRDSKTGLITDLGGLTPEFKNTDNGNVEEEEQFIKVGVVQESGPDCKWLRRGDTVFYAKPSAIPVPFYKQGFENVCETRVMAVINEGLSKRFEDYKNDSKV